MFTGYMGENLDNSPETNKGYLGRLNEKYSKHSRLLISLSALFLVLFLVTALILPFRDQLLSSLYPKPQSKAAEQEVSEELKGPESSYVTDELLIKVKKSAKQKIAEPRMGATNIKALDRISQNQQLAKVEKVIIENQNTQTDLSLWHKITLDENKQKNSEARANTEVSPQISRFDDESEKRLKLERLKLLKEELEADPDIEAVEYNYIARINQTPILTPSPSASISATLKPIATDVPLATITPTVDLALPVVNNPNDPYYSSSGSWGQLYDDLWGLKKINAVEAWTKTQGEGVIVAVVDTGLDYNHTDIQGNIWVNNREVPGNGIDDDGNGYIDDNKGWDFVTLDDDREDNDPLDDHGHGTHVSGTIAAVANNAQGIAGVAPKAKIMALKGLDGDGSGSISDLAHAIYYAANNGAGVINASWGGSVSNIDLMPTILLDAINYAHDVKNVVFVAAAGNSYADVSHFFPASYRNVITVSSADHLDQRSDFSNYGQKIDVSAPGGDSNSDGNNFYNNILSLRARNTDMYGGGAMVVGSNYYRSRGTSMATPHAAGVAALIRALHPAWNTEQIRQVIRVNSDDIGASGFDFNSGYGRINALKASNFTDEPLMVHLTRPNAQKIDANSVSIYGQVGGVDLANWKLEYGLGGNPLSWQSITTSSTPYISESLLVNWDVSSIPDGAYSLRLTAQNTSGNLYEDRTNFTLDRIAITSPDPKSVSYIKGGQTVNITGTVAIPNLKSYTFIIDRLTDNGNQKIEAQLTVANGGLQTVHNGLLATWDTANLVAGKYSIALLVSTLDSRTWVEYARVVIDPTIHTGWPKNMGLIGYDSGGLSFVFAMSNHLNTADINGDGKSDLLVGYGDKVNIFDHSGNNLPGWPQSVTTSKHPTAATQQSPVAADLNNDGKLEIVAYSTNTSHDGSGDMFVWSAEGQIMPDWPKQFSVFPRSFSIDDIDGDGQKEIIYADDFGEVGVLKMDGKYLSGWPKRLDVDGDFRPLGTPTVADVDKDGKKEIIIVNMITPTKLYIFKSTGQIMAGWPKSISNIRGGFPQVDYSYPAVADLDNNRDLEIVIGTGDGKVIAFHHNGAVVSGWPKTIASGNMVKSPTIGDLDNDGKPEVVAADVSGYLFAWKGNGSLLPGWPVYIPGCNYSLCGFQPAAIVDLDNDGFSEVVASYNDGLSGTNNALKAYRYDGTVFPEFPKIALSAEWWPTNTPAVADLDGDGLLEVAWLDASTNLYVWDLAGKINNRKNDWPMFQHDAANSGYYSPLSTITPTPTPTPGLGGNLLINGGFETGSSNWSITAWLSKFINVDSTMSRSGSNSLHIEGKGSGIFTQQDVSVAAGKRVNLSGYINIPQLISGMSAVIELQPLNKNNGNIGSPVAVGNFKTTTNGWTSFSRSAVMPNNTVKLRVRVRIPALNGKVFVDDLVLTSN